jgi:ABC-type Fe3+ transport system permease subunit
MQFFTALILIAINNEYYFGVAVTIASLSLLVTAVLLVFERRMWEQLDRALAKKNKAQFVDWERIKAEYTHPIETGTMVYRVEAADKLIP